jgi:DNA-binding NarL/FixJ family response regulator
MRRAEKDLMIPKYFKLRSIIVADDQVFVREMTQILESLGFDKVEVVPNRIGLQERQTYERHDLILADGELTSDDCSDLLLSMRIDPLLPPTSFVVVSRDTSRRFRERCLRRGADAVIHKSLAAQELARAVVSLLESRAEISGALRVARRRS